MLVSLKIPRKVGAAVLICAIAAMVVITGLPATQKAQAAYVDPPNYVIGLHTQPKITKLIYPTIGNPAIVKRAASFTIEWDPREGKYFDPPPVNQQIPLPTCTDFTVTATTTNGGPGTITVPLTVSQTVADYSTQWPLLKPGGGVDRRVYLVTTNVPYWVPDDLYNLTVSCTIESNTYTDTQTNALDVITDFKSNPNFIQMSDIHVYGPENPNASIFYSHSRDERSARRTTYDAGPNGQGWGATYLHKEIMEINRIHPDFCIFTGDYDFGQRYFQENQGGAWGTNTQYEYEQLWFYQEIQALEVPVYIVIGNHDGYNYATSFGAPIEQDWLNNWTHLYSPLYFTFNYGPDNKFFAVNTMEWSGDQRALQNYLNIILQPVKYLGEALGSGDDWGADISQARLDAINVAGFTGQLGWLRDQLAASQSAKSRVLCMHHDPWKDNGSGSMWASGGSDFISQITGMLDMGNGEGRLALIKLAATYKVALMIHGHDHSDCTSEDDSNKALLNWVGTDGTNGQHTISQNTTSSSFQTDGTSASYPGYRRVWINDGTVTQGGNESLNYQEPYWSWPAYAGTTVGGNTNLNNLSTPAVQQNWMQTPGPSTEDVTCTLTNSYNKPLSGMYLEFPMKYLSGNYYYTVTNGTLGQTFDVPEASPTVRQNQVYTNMAAGQQNRAVRVAKSASPDDTVPTGSVSINDGAATTEEADVTLTLDASDPQSGVGRMMISNDQAFTGAHWEPYATTRPWTLPGGTAGTQTVYVKYSDRSMPGNEAIKSDTIYFNYTPPSGPKISVVNPPSGQQGVQCQMVVTGINTHFVNGVTEVTFNGQAHPTDFQIWQNTVQSPTQCTIWFTPNANAQIGARDVGVNNGAEQVTPFHNGFTVEGCMVTDVTPSTARAGDSLSLHVVATQTHFVQNMTKVRIWMDGQELTSPFGNNMITQPPTGATVISPTEFTVPITINPDQPAGMCDVGAYTGSEYAAPLSGSFEIRSHYPHLTSVTPDSGIRGHTYDVDIVGVDTTFSGSSVANFGSGITVNSTDVTNATHASANITIQSGATPGTRDVKVTTGTQVASLADGFGVEYPAPTVASIAPATAYNTGTVHITNLAGTYFRQTPTVTLSKSSEEDIVAANVHYTSAQQLTCDLNLNGKTAGLWNVTVTNPDGKSDTLNAAFNVQNLAPTVTSITPNTEVNTNSNLPITNLAGANFRDGATVKLTKTGQADIIPNNGTMTVMSPTLITCNFDLTGKQGGSWNVVVTNYDGKSGTLANGFKITYPNAPVATGIVPATGESGSVVHGVSVAGTDFMSGATVKLKKGTTELVAGGVQVVSDTEITCDVDLSGAISGRWDVIVANADDQASTLHSAFNVTRTVRPTLTRVSPTSGPVGSTVTLTGTDFGASNQAGNSRVSFNGTDAVTYISWADTRIQCKVPTGASSGPVYVYTVAGGSSGVDFTVTRSAPPPTAPTPTWYLAEGTSDYGFDTYITIENPNSTAVTGHVTYMTKAGPRSRAALTLPPMSQTVINPRNDIVSMDFSTKVQCEEGKSIYVDRRMTWTGAGAASSEGHSSVGVPAPAKTWYLPEGSSKWGFETWLLVQNPGTTDATVTLTYMIEGRGPVPVKHTVPASSRASFNMGTDIGPADASIKVSSNVPVIPERAMYRNNRREGHDSIGTTTPAREYYLAEGTTDWGFTTYVLVQNPNSSKATVNITYMTPKGPVAQPAFTMDPNSRKTINVNQVVPAKDLSIDVKGSAPIIAERAMYWDKGLGEACHDSIGMDSPHMNFYLPDGETGPGMETWTLVQNPNDSPVTVKISYLTQGGKGGKSFTDKVPANSRKSYTLSDVFSTGRAAILVQSQDKGLPIMVERSMYWNNRGAGTDTIGGFSD